MQFAETYIFQEGGNRMKALPRRVEYLDIAKGIGILLVVWAHARGPYNAYIYQFHMPLFFLISGFLYSRKSTVKEFILKKIKSLYIPFVFWNLLFYFGETAANFDITKWKEMARFTLCILLAIEKDGQFLGASWFLGSLFLMSILYKIIDTIIPESPAKDAVVLALFAAFAIIGFQITLPHFLSRTIILGLFFAIGAFVKKRRDLFAPYNCAGAAVVSALIFIVIGHYNSANMGANEYTSPVLFVIGALMASYALIYFCKAIEKSQNTLVTKAKAAILLLGRRSMDIVIWQFVAFRIGIAAQMYLNHEEMTISNLLSYYPLYSEAHGWWIIYLVIGLVVPLLWCQLLRAGLWGKLFQKLHIV